MFFNCHTCRVDDSILELKAYAILRTFSAYHTYETPSFFLIAYIVFKTQFTFVLGNTFMDSCMFQESMISSLYFKKRGTLLWQAPKQTLHNDNKRFMIS